MKQYVVGIVRFVAVIAGIVVLTSFSVDATDLLRGSQSALGIFARKVTEVGCPIGMVEIPGATRLCIDAYEASGVDTCPFPNPQSSNETVNNANDPDCIPESVPNSTPWTHVAIVQAEQLCARAGKRLPTPSEWFLAAKGTPDNVTSCNLDGELSTTASDPLCVSGIGSYDMVGNVWEWVSGAVVDGKHRGTTLASEGYVTSISEEGLPIASSPSAKPIFNDDYVWSVAEGNKAMMRGGFHGSRSDGGVYSTHAAIDQGFESAAVGFRCVAVLP